MRMFWSAAAMGLIISNGTITAVMTKLGGLSMSGIFPKTIVTLLSLRVACFIEKLSFG